MLFRSKKINLLDQQIGFDVLLLGKLIERSTTKLAKIKSCWIFIKLRNFTRNYENRDFS